MPWFRRKKKTVQPLSEHEREVLEREEAERVHDASREAESFVSVPGRLQDYFSRGRSTRGSFPGLTGIGLRRYTEDRRGWSERAKDEV